MILCLFSRCMSWEIGDMDETSRRGAGGCQLPLKNGLHIWKSFLIRQISAKTLCKYITNIWPKMVSNINDHKEFSWKFGLNQSSSLWGVKFLDPSHTNIFTETLTVLKNILLLNRKASIPRTSPPGPRLLKNGGRAPFERGE